jgi:hypothetical protein
MSNNIDIEKLNSNMTDNKTVSTLEDLEKELKNIEKDEELGKTNSQAGPYNKGPTQTILFCVYGKEFSNTFLVSWSELIIQCMQNNYRPLLSMNYDKNVFLSKNVLLGGNIRTHDRSQKVFQGNLDYDYILFLDKNIIFNFNDLTKLIESPYECTSGVYLLNNEFSNVVINFNKQAYQEQSAINFIKHEELVQMDNKIDNRYVKSDFVDMGWMMFKKGTLEKVSYPWFDYDIDNTISVFSDSYAFCNKLKKHNIDIMVDTNFKMNYIFNQ